MLLGVELGLGVLLGVDEGVELGVPDGELEGVELGVLETVLEGVELGVLEGSIPPQSPAFRTNQKSATIRGG